MWKINNLINKYKKMSPAVKASLWFVICNVLQRGIGFLTTPIFTRIMSTDEYGQYSLFQTWHSIIFIFATLELTGGVYNKGLAKFPKDRNKFTTSMLGLSSASTVLLFIIFLCFKDFFVERIQLPEKAIILLFCDLFFASAINFWSTKKRFEFDYVPIVFVSLAISVISSLLGIIFVVNSSEKGIARIASICITNICFGVVIYLLILIKSKHLCVYKYWKYGLLFNLPLIPHYLSTMILGQADKVMIQRAYGEGCVAKYSVVYTLSMLMNIVTTSINSSFIPWTYQKCEKRDFKSLSIYSLYLLAFIGILSLIPSLLGPEIIRIIAPSEYYDAVYVIPPVACSVYFIFLYTLFANIEFAFEETKFVAVASVLAGLSNILLNLVFLKLCGYIAAAYTTLACYLLLAIAHAAFYKRVLRKNNIDNIYNIKIVLAISSVVCIGSLMISLLYSLTLIRYVFIIALIAILLFNKTKIISIISAIKNRG